MRFEAGVLVGERYELVQSVASGGMGDVWRARDRVLGRPVAVKKDPSTTRWGLRRDRRLRPPPRWGG